MIRVPDDVSYGAVFVGTQTKLDSRVVCLGVRGIAAEVLALRGDALADAGAEQALVVGVGVAQLLVGDLLAVLLGAAADLGTRMATP
jgi:hypothetical protein